MFKFEHLSCRHGIIDNSNSNSKDYMFQGNSNSKDYMFQGNSNSKDYMFQGNSNRQSSNSISNMQSQC